MLGAGFKPDVHNQRRLAEQLGKTPNETLCRFEAVISSKVAPTKDVAAYLGEVVVHATDVRIPLGVATVPSIEALTPVVEFFARRNFVVPSRTVARGLTLRATDGPFVAGETPKAGTEPEVSGSTLALVMAMAGRQYFLDQLAGDGVSILRERLSR
ncbi:MAG: hypothetical protein HIU81_09425 [Acidobacteria bacterium]|nr:hypothetical protein [Acidobacteriota bacterium]